MSNSLKHSESADHFIFWMELKDGRPASISTNNLFEASRQARLSNATKLFVRNPGSGRVASLKF